MRIDDWISSAEDRLAKAGVLEPRLDAQLLAAAVTTQSRSWVLAHPEAEIPDTVEALLARREQREPLALILGYREFYGRRFFVEPGTLVPRQETETIVDVALEGMGGKVLDIGTGTGCLALTIKLERPNWMVAACDVSPVAVRLARKNADALGALVHVTRSNLYEAFGDVKFGLIVSNPPYIAEGASLPPEVADFEPALALYAGHDGLDVYRRLALESMGHLMPWGRLVLEVGDGMSDDVIALFEAQGWANTDVRNDLSGVPRAVVFQPKP
ncbi:MAG: peptide chain release factor N(5)-glutamine methyltransferase [Armatimonadetes bacterium]|nr:peptide chain release factor N(5)-glutamine methyltransferase [Armatimonadota bacterium]